MITKKFYLKPIPKIETELNLINTMVNILTYESQFAEKPNETVIQMAHSILENKLLELEKVLKNPSRFDSQIDENTDLIS